MQLCKPDRVRAVSENAELSPLSSPRGRGRGSEKLMKRKITVLALSAMLFALCGSADAQQPGKILRIGYLDNSTASGSAVLVDAFRQEMRKLGWIEGKNITIEYRFAEQKNERLSELAADLVRLKFDLIVGASTNSALAAKSVTTTIPIVMVNVGDPVGAGLVASLARPGGNVTGNASLSPELITKRLEILKDAVPKLARVGLLRSPTSITTEIQLKELKPTALALKLKLEEIETQPDPKGLESFKPQSRSRSTRLCCRPLANFSPKESGSSSSPLNTGCRLFTTRKSLSMRVVSCLMELTTMTYTGARLFTWTRS
jgi:ABC transporter substrate binding protein